MSCGGNMMRTSFQPLAHLVDAAAEKWVAAENASEREQSAVRHEITNSFRIGDNFEMTFHGIKYQLIISRCSSANSAIRPREFSIRVHEISQES
jgi:hypothetical protein